MKSKGKKILFLSMAVCLVICCAWRTTISSKAIDSCQRPTATGVQGDANGDGQFNISDLVRIKSEIAGVSGRLASQDACFVNGVCATEKDLTAVRHLLLDENYVIISGEQMVRATEDTLVNIDISAAGGIDGGFEAGASGAVKVDGENIWANYGADETDGKVYSFNVALDKLAAKKGEVRELTAEFQKKDANGAVIKTTTVTVYVSVWDQLISNANELEDFVWSIKLNGSAKYVAMTADIDCKDSTFTANEEAGFPNWSLHPSNSGFTGVFDGRGHVIKNFNPTQQGMFGNASGAVIKNISFADAVLDDNEGALIVAGNAGDVVYENIYAEVAAKSGVKVAVLEWNSAWANSVKNVFVVFTENQATSTGLVGTAYMAEQQWNGAYVVGAKSVAASEPINDLGNNTYGAYDTRSAMKEAGLNYNFWNPVFWDIVDDLPCPKGMVQKESIVISEEQMVRATEDTLVNIDISAAGGIDGGFEAGNTGAVKVDGENIWANHGIESDGKVYSFNVALAKLAEKKGEVRELTAEFQKKDVNGAVIKITTVTVYVSVWDQLISNATELEKFVWSIKVKDSAKYVAMTADIDCKDSTFTANEEAGFPNWSLHPSNSGFTGVFDGRGHVIKNFNPTQQGMFGNASGAVIKNISFVDAVLDDNEGALIVAGNAGDVVYENIYAEVAAKSGVKAAVLEWNSAWTTSVKNVFVVFTENQAAGTGLVGTAYMNVQHWNGAYVVGAKSVAASETIKDWGNNTYGAYLTRETMKDAISGGTLDFDSWSGDFWTLDEYGIPYHPSTLNAAYVANVLHVNEVAETATSFVQNGTSDYQIVKGSSAEAAAAANLIQTHVRNSTNCMLPIKEEQNVEWDENAKYIAIGTTELFRKAGLTMPSQSLGASGHYIVSKENSVFLNCEKVTGLNAAALTFLHYTIGYDMYAADTVVYNKDGRTMPRFHVINKPDFEYQITGNYNEQYRIEGMGYYPGLTFIPTDGALWHNSFVYLPKEQYLAEHPKWYSDSVASDSFGGQLCYTAHGDPDELIKMQDAVLIKMIQYVKENPGIDRITFTQQDRGAFCNCDACANLKDQYGTHAASVIQFVNVIAERLNQALADEGRSVIVNFFAYQETLQPPKMIDDQVKCSKYVGVICALDKAVYTESFYDSANTEAKHIIETWNQISAHMSYWLYNTNFEHYLYPYPVYESMMDAYRICKRNNGDFIYFMGQYNQKTATGFNVFKEYLASRAMWDVNLNYHEVERDFFEHYFGSAYEPMFQYYEGMKRHFHYIKDQNGGKALGLYDNLAQEKFWPKETLEQWMELINEAYASIAPLQNENPDLYKKLYNHIRVESLFPRYALITLYDMQDMRAAFKADCVELGVTQKNEAVELQKEYDAWGV